MIIIREFHTAHKKTNYKRMKTALLIVDVQNDYFKGGAMPLDDAFEACKNIRFILERFRDKNLPVIYIRHLSSRPGATFFIPGTSGSEIHPLLQPLPEEVVVEKHYPNSFRQTNLLTVLQDLKITDLVVCGMMTHMCVDATVRAAKDLGFDCTVISDACATRALSIQGKNVSSVDVQTAFLSAFEYFYATVLNTQQYL